MSLTKMHSSLRPTNPSDHSSYCLPSQCIPSRFWALGSALLHLASFTVTIMGLNIYLLFDRRYYTYTHCLAQSQESWRGRLLVGPDRRRGPLDGHCCRRGWGG